MNSQQLRALVKEAVELLVRKTLVPESMDQLQKMTAKIPDDPTADELVQQAPTEKYRDTQYQFDPRPQQTLETLADHFSDNNDMVRWLVKKAATVSIESKLRFYQYIELARKMT